MDATDPKDIESFWADSPEMGAKCQAYQQRAHSALDLHFIHPDIYTPWKGTGYQGSSRVRIFELQQQADGADLANGSPELRDARELLHHWQQGTPAQEGILGQPRRRVIILQDMNVRVIKLLGVLLDIPPEFFLAHCSGRVELGVVDGAGTKQGSSAYWRVDVQQRRVIPRDFDGPYGTYNVETGAVDRGMFKILQLQQNVNYYGFVSYWARKYGGGSWTALILVDPHQAQLGYVNPRGGPRLGITLEDYTPPFSIYHQVPMDSVASVDAPLQPFKRPIFDALVDAYSSSSLASTDDPFDTMVCARNIIRSIWEERIQRDATDIFSEIRRDHDTQRLHADGPSATQNGTQEGSIQQQQQNDRVLRSYQRLMDMRLTTTQNLQLLRMILWKFEFRHAEPKSSHEVRAWLHLETRLEELEAHVGSHLKMYAQRAVMRESFEASRQTAASNRLARSSGQLTKIATVVVPCTIVASVFSMNGEFAAGESLFFVYWAISIPVTLALLLWVMHGDILDAMRRLGTREYASTVRGRSLRQTEADLQGMDEEKVA